MTLSELVDMIVNVHGILQFYDLNREIDSFAGFYEINKRNRKVIRSQDAITIVQA